LEQSEKQELYDAVLSKKIKAYKKICDFVIDTCTETKEKTTPGAEYELYGKKIAVLPEVAKVVMSATDFCSLILNG